MLKWNGGGNPTTFIMKKYLIIQDTVVKGEKVQAGSVVELDEQEGNALVGYNKAELHVAKKTVKADRSVGLEESEAPKVSKRKAKK